MLNNNLDKFTVKALVEGVSVDRQPSIGKDFSGEIGKRGHLKLISVVEDLPLGGMVVTVELESTNKDLAARMFSEELMEISSAVVEKINMGVSVKVLEVV